MACGKQEARNKPGGADIIAALEYNRREKMVHITSNFTEERIRSYQVGPGDRLTFTSLFQLLQESAYLHAEMLGWGYQMLQDKGWFWLLSKMKVEILQAPLWNEELRIQTAPYKPAGLWAPRDFLIHNKKGDLLCRATSHWLLVDKENKRPLPPAKLFGDLTFEHEDGLCALPFSRIRGEMDETSLDSRTVYTSHLDQNGHMNNSRYVDFVMDSLSIDEQMQIKGLEIHYLQEAFTGDTLDVFRGEDSGHQTLRVLRRDGKDVLSARLFGADAT